MEKIEATIQTPPKSILKFYSHSEREKKRYKKWLKEISSQLPEKEMINGKVAVFLNFYHSHSGKSNLDNFLKGALDLIVEKGWIQGKKFIDFLQSQKFKVIEKDEEKIEIRIVKL